MEQLKRNLKKMDETITDLQDILEKLMLMNDIAINDAEKHEQTVREMIIYDYLKREAACLEELNAASKTVSEHIKATEG